MTEEDAGPVELALAVALKLLAVWLPIALLLLAVPQADGDRLLDTIAIHLTTVVAIGLMATSGMLVLTRAPWFVGPVGARERFATIAGLVSIVVGLVALLTLASSAALRYDPSMQMLQLLSALDVAWVTSATMVGASWIWGRRVGRVAAWLMTAACVFSNWNYLRVVGFDADGGWVVDGGELVRLVLPFDVVAAVIAVGLGVVASRRAVSRGLHHSV